MISTKEAKPRAQGWLLKNQQTLPRYAYVHVPAKYKRGRHKSIRVYVKVLLRFPEGNEHSYQLVCLEIAKDSFRIANDWRDNFENYRSSKNAEVVLGQSDT